MGAKDEIVTTEILVPHDHAIFVRRDHHIMVYLRELSLLTGGSVGFPVAELDSLWLKAYEIGIEHGAALAAAAKKSAKAK